MKRRPSYTRQFKKDAVSLAVEHGYSCDEVARRLGVDRSTIFNWVRRFKEEGENSLEGRRAAATVESEAQRLEKENKRLKMENEILKKAAAYFAKELN